MRTCAHTHCEDIWLQAMLADLQPKGEALDRARQHVEKLERELKNRVQQGTLQQGTISSLEQERDALQTVVGELRQEVHAAVIANRRQSNIPAHPNPASTCVRTRMHTHIRACALKKTRKVSLVKMDKDYLVRDAQAVNDRIQKMQQQQAQLERKIDNYKHKKHRLKDELEQLRHRQLSGHEDRIEKELSMLRDRSAHELEEVRRTNREAFERENNTLREAREQFRLESEKNHNQYITCRQQLDDLKHEHARLTDGLEGQTSELRNELNLKCFELERLTMTHDETKAALRQARVEMETLQKKVDVLRQEYYELQASSTRQLAGLEASVAARQEKLALYEQVATHPYTHVDVQACTYAICLGFGVTAGRGRA